MLAPDMLAPSREVGGVAGRGAVDPRLREVAEEFEAVFLAQVLQTMSVGLGGPGPLGDSDNEAWAGMLQEEYGRLISKSGGIGVADALLREMLKMQEVG